MHQHMLNFFIYFFSIACIKCVPQGTGTLEHTILGTLNVACEENFGHFQYEILVVQYDDEKSRSINENHSLGHETISSSPSIEVELGGLTT